MNSFVEATIANLTAVGSTAVISFHYNSTARAGTIEKIGPTFVLIKHTAQTAERVGKAYSNYTLSSIEGKVCVPSV